MDEERERLWAESGVHLEPDPSEPSIILTLPRHPPSHDRLAVGKAPLASLSLPVREPDPHPHLSRRSHATQTTPVPTDLRNCIPRHTQHALVLLPVFGDLSRPDALEAFVPHANAPGFSPELDRPIVPARGESEKLLSSR
jgi:hypothetical protein